MLKLLTLIVVAAVMAAAGPAAAEPATMAADAPLASFDHRWEDDPTWYDGMAEAARYDATRMIYGQLRRFGAVLYTNKERADAEPTFTKSADGEGREVFKHHLREDVPTENYAYHFSTMVYVGADDLKSLKLDVGSIEDCGTTFKQYVHHDGDLRWMQASYFPGEGHRSGGYEPPAGFVFHDALSVVLRGFPFDDPPPTDAPLTLHVLPDQTTNKLSPPEPVEATVTYQGRETLDLPIGKVEAHHVRVRMPSDTLGTHDEDHDYWFAADGEAPWLHVMVQYTGPNALTYTLRSLDREAYWEQ